MSDQGGTTGVDIGGMIPIEGGITAITSTTIENMTEDRMTDMIEDMIGDTTIKENMTGAPIEDTISMTGDMIGGIECRTKEKGIGYYDLPLIPFSFEG